LYCDEVDGGYPGGLEKAYAFNQKPVRQFLLFFLILELISGIASRFLPRCHLCSAGGLALAATTAAYKEELGMQRDFVYVHRVWLTVVKGGDMGGWVCMHVHGQMQTLARAHAAARESACPCADMPGRRSVHTNGKGCMLQCLPHHQGVAGNSKQEV
jgi:hypothetical protein